MSNDEKMSFFMILYLGGLLENSLPLYKTPLSFSEKFPPPTQSTLPLA